MKRISLIVGLLALIAVTALFLTDVTEADVIVYESPNYKAAKAAPLSAGDVVILDKEGDLSRLCNVTLQQENLDERPVNTLYVNRANEHIAWAAGLLGSLKLLNQDKITSLTDKGAISFTGRQSAIKSEQYVPKDIQSCYCDIALAQAKGDLVCTVDATLIRTSLLSGGEYPTTPAVDSSIAVLLRRHAYHIPPNVFEQCGVEITSQVGIAQQRLCSDHDTIWPPDVRMRAYLGLIEKKAVAQPARFLPR